MTRARAALKPVEEPILVPQYELRAREFGPDDLEVEIWQVPSPASPHLGSAVRIAGLRGRNLSLIEHRLIRRLKRDGIELSGLYRTARKSFSIHEEAALNLGLLFRVLAPMRDREKMAACANGIEAMEREEAAYWLGMAMHRRHPRRVLTALRFLLTDPRRE